jgi:hypothetical protein
MKHQYRVTVELAGKHPIHTNYPLLPGDILTKHPVDGWTKHAPGLAIWGFELTDEDVKTLELADEARWSIA